MYMYIYIYIYAHAYTYLCIYVYIYDQVAAAAAAAADRAAQPVITGVPHPGSVAVAQLGSVGVPQHVQHAAAHQQHLQQPHATPQCRQDAPDLSSPGDRSKPSKVS